MKRVHLQSAVLGLVALLAGVRESAVSAEVDQGAPAATTPARDNVVNTKRWVRLRNDDRLTARFGCDSLILSADGGTRSIATAQIETMRFDSRKTGQVVAVLSDGTVVRGTLTGEIPFQLEAGPKLSLALEALALISSSEEASSPVRAGSGPAISISDTNAPEGFVWIPPGEFLMGSPTEEAGRDLDEGPQTRVILPQGFWMAQCEVTQAEYRRVVGTNPSVNTGDAARPVEKVTWYEAMDYCAKLTQASQAEGQLPRNHVYRLPTEAEWEYACRAGSGARFSYGEDKSESQLPAYAWFTRNSESMTHPVGKKEPNAWGLFDMHGNVWEWCLDRWQGGLPGGTITNRAVAASGTLRAARGGSWLYEPRACRCANRDDYGASNRCSDLGFRVVLAREE